MNNLYLNLEQFADTAFASSTDSIAPKHLRRTVDWLKVLKPDADEALIIAARAHDIERAFRQEDMKKLLKASADGFGNAEFLRLHQTRGAEILGKFLEEQGADTTLIERVKHLVEHHEDGGDDDQNLLKDADTLSFFENNVGHFIQKRAAEYGREKVAAKFTWMFARLTAEKAKGICRPWYVAAMKRLGGE